MVKLPQTETVPMTLTLMAHLQEKLLTTVVQNIELVHCGLFLPLNGVTCRGKSCQDLFYFTFSKNNTGYDASTSPLKIKGLLILLTEEISIRMNQAEHVHHQANSWDRDPHFSYL